MRARFRVAWDERCDFSADYAVSVVNAFKEAKYEFDLKKANGQNGRHCEYVEYFWADARFELLENIEGAFFDKVWDFRGHGVFAELLLEFDGGTSDSRYHVRWPDDSVQSTIVSGLPRKGLTGNLRRVTCNYLPNDIIFAVEDERGFERVCAASTDQRIPKSLEDSAKTVEVVYHDKDVTIAGPFVELHSLDFIMEVLRDNAFAVGPLMSFMIWEV